MVPRWLRSVPPRPPRSEATAAAGPALLCNAAAAQTHASDRRCRRCSQTGRCGLNCLRLMCRPPMRARQANNAATLTTTPDCPRLCELLLLPNHRLLLLLCQSWNRRTRANQIAAAAFANPKFDPSADYSAYAAASPFDNAMADLPASFVGRHSVDTGTRFKTVTAASLLSKDERGESDGSARRWASNSPVLHIRNRAGDVENISYLAHHAISNQKELEERWRVGGQARKSTRSRYGF
jgi:hypothetical protein